MSDEMSLGKVGIQIQLPGNRPPMGCFGSPYPIPANSNVTVLDILNKCVCGNGAQFGFAYKYVQEVGLLLERVYSIYTVSKDNRPCTPKNPQASTPWKLYRNNVLDPIQALEKNMVQPSDDLLFKYVKASLDTENRDEL